MLEITPDIVIPEDELETTAIRSRGAGGQNVNKVATAVQLRFNIGASPSLPEELRERLLARRDRRISRDGVAVIRADRYRSREQNLRDARARLAALLASGLRVPPRRVPTRPPRRAAEQRLEDKRRRGRLKEGRRRPDR